MKPARLRHAYPEDGSVTFINYDDDVVDKYVEVAERHNLELVEVLEMVKIAALAQMDLDEPPPLLEELQMDEAHLNSAKDYPLTLAQLFEIRERAGRAIAYALSRETDPVKRLKLEAMLQPSENWLRIEARLKERT